MGILNLKIIFFVILLAMIPISNAYPKVDYVIGVEIKGFAFDPATITVAKGTTVTWMNKDSTPHTVTEIGNAFSSDTLNQDQSYTHTFNEIGMFEYNCQIHPSMLGKVIVTETVSPTPTITPTTSSTPIPTPTLSPSVTPTPTITPTISATSTPTVFPTVSPTPNSQLEQEVKDLRERLNKTEEKQAQQETRISWLESVINSLLDRIKSIF